MSQKSRKSYVLLIFFICLLIIISYVVYTGEYFTLAKINKHRALLDDFVDRHYIISLFVYTLLYTAMGLFLIPGAAVLNMAGGFLFGLYHSVIVSVIGGTLGAFLSYKMITYISRLMVQSEYDDEYEDVKQRARKHGVYYLMALRVSSVVPNSITNFVAGIVHVPLYSYVVTSFLSFIPRCFIYSLAGQEIATLDSLYDVMSFEIVSIIVLLVGLSFIPIFFKKTDKPG
jgi:uncharacterized membrane protein YdjX (TVP38/TMEM64 family)